MSRRKAWVAWSSGKDSAWALHLVRQSDELEVAGLLTTVTETFGRVSMHAVREELLKAQAEAVGLPLYPVYIPSPCPNEAYEAAMKRVLKVAISQGVTCMVFGDVSLADVRAYREGQLARANLVGCFPLWMQDGATLAREMIRSGLCAYLTCVDPRKLPGELVGSAFDESFLARLPAGADPCGENGEFHTFVWDGPMFEHPIRVRLGETVEREGFLFKDVLPAAPRDPDAEESRQGRRKP